MAAMIQNDDEKEWMLPLLELRNELDVANDKPLRDFRRLTGNVTLFHDEPVHGPYTQDSREHWLTRVLEAQTWIRANGPELMRTMDLITMEELHEIRRIWVFEKHEIEDILPRIYQETTGEVFPGRPLNEHMVLGSEDVELLREICGDDALHFEMTRSLIAVERRFRTMTRRAGLFDELEKVVKRSFYIDKDDAVNRARDVIEVRDLRTGRGAQSALDLELSGSMDLAQQSRGVKASSPEESADVAH